MDEEFINKIQKERQVKFTDLPDDFDVTIFPKDTEIIFEEDFPELEDSFWDEEYIPFIRLSERYFYTLLMTTPLKFFYQPSGCPNFWAHDTS